MKLLDVTSLATTVLASTALVLLTNAASQPEQEMPRRDISALSRIRSHCSAKDTLQKMGVALAFDMNRADFDRMIVKSPSANRVFLSEIYHDAWVAADEKGTEAAAATTIIENVTREDAPMKEPPAVFHADHPFLFFIVHNESRSILFAGLVANPKELAGDSKAK